MMGMLSAHGTKPALQFSQVGILTSFFQQEDGSHNTYRWVNHLSNMMWFCATEWVTGPASEGVESILSNPTVSGHLLKTV